MIHINDNFNEEVKSYKGKCVVDFWASWCGPCKMFGPIFENASKKVKDVKFCKLNVDEDTQDISREYGVMSIPTIILFKDGEEVKRNIGLLDEEALLNFLGEE